MKTKFFFTSSLRRHFCGAALAAALLLPGLQARGQNSPVGTTWDCVMSGARNGLANMTFFANSDSSSNYFIAYEVLVTKQPKVQVSESALGRNDGDAGRTPGTADPAPPPLPAHTDIFGSEWVTGPWSFDAQGHVIGYFFEIAKPTCVTNTIPISTNTFVSLIPIIDTPPQTEVYCVTLTISTNTLADSTNYICQTTCYTNELKCTGLTNSISFVAKVVPGKRLTLVNSTPAGKVTYRGIPAIPLPDLSGSYYGIKKMPSRLWFTEFFTLTRSETLMNAYVVQGGGPNYTYSGHALFSAQKKIGFSLGLDPDANVVRAVVGSFNAQKMAGTLRGMEEPSHEARPRFTFSIKRQSP